MAEGLSKLIGRTGGVINLLHASVIGLDQLCTSVVTSEERGMNVKCFERVKVRGRDVMKEASNKMSEMAEAFSKAESSVQSGLEMGPLSEGILKEAADKMTQLAKAFNEASEAFERFDRVCGRLLLESR